jgi:hypothetical protein
VAVSPLSLSASALFQYVSFDFLWWVLLTFALVKRLQSGDERWWLLIGASIGLAVLTKYTIAFLVAGLAVAVIATPLRRDLLTRWLWLGALVATVIAAPNLVWQFRHDFASLEFLRAIHERDVEIGRTDHFLVEQLYLASAAASVPFWMAGLHAFTVGELRRFRAVAILLLVTFALFVIAHGRGYYTAPLFPVAVAAGATVLTRWSDAARPLIRRLAFGVVALLFAGCVALSVVVLPVAPVGSALWKITSSANSDLREEIGWPELAQEVARVYRSLPAEERARTAIFCSNYGEAGALELYGPPLGLPQPVSPVNTFWLRGYGDGSATTIIVLGADREDVEQSCRSVSPVGTISNRHGVENEETREHKTIYLCRELTLTWPKIWTNSRSFG